MNFLKSSIVAIALGLVFMACNTSEVCYECTASDPNNVGTPVSDEICQDNLSESEKAAFYASFTSQHDPSMYDISCAEK